MSFRMYAQTPPPHLFKRSCLYNLIVVFNHVSDSVSASVFVFKRNSLSCVKWAVLRSDLMFKWTILKCGDFGCWVFIVGILTKLL